MTQKPKPDEPTTRDNDGLHRRRGVWYYCLTIAGKRRFFSTKSRNYQDARKVRATAVKAQLEHKLPNDLARWPFRKLLDKVLTDRRPRLAENSIALERARGRQLATYFQDRRISEIGIDQIREYQTERLKTVSTRTVNLELKVLRFVLKEAKTWATVADSYKALPERKPEVGRALEDVQERLLFDVARSKQVWDSAFLAALAASATTMRSCELKALRLKNINLMDREVNVSRSKTEGGRGRRIPLNDLGLWSFSRLIERANALGATEPEHYLFPKCRYRETRNASRGAGYDPTRPQKGWRSAWRSLTKEAARRATAEGIDSAALAGLRFHDLRHTSITKLAESGASDETVMAIAGHLSRQMMEYYSHIRMNAKRRAVEAIKSSFEVTAEAPPLATNKVQ